MFLGAFVCLFVIGAAVWLTSRTSNSAPTIGSNEPTHAPPAAHVDPELDSAASSRAPVRSEEGRHEEARSQGEESSPPPTATADDEVVLKNLPAQTAAASIHPILGGQSAIESAHASSTQEQRAQRLDDIEKVLELYSDGEPKDKAEFEVYEALKDEALWLRNNPRPPKPH